jgi:hypothetical protein
LHRYLYAYGNPGVYIDPNGHFLLPVHEEIVERAASSKINQINNRNKGGISHTRHRLFASGLKAGSVQPDIPEGKIGALKTFDLEYSKKGGWKGVLQKDHNKKSLTYRSHFGDLQHWHFMRNDEKDPVKLRGKVIDRMVILTKESRSLLDTNPEEAGYRLGKALHTVHDSYTRSHVQRDKDGNIERIQDYKEQDHIKHGTADTKDNKIDIDKAVHASEQIITYATDKEFDEEEYREYLRNKIFKFKGEDKGKIEVDMGGTHEDFAKEEKPKEVEQIDDDSWLDPGGA